MVRIAFACSFPMKFESPFALSGRNPFRILSALFARSPSKRSIIRPVHYNRTLYYSSNMFRRTRSLCCILIFHVFGTFFPCPCSSLLARSRFLSPRDSELIPEKNSLMQHAANTNASGGVRERDEWNCRVQKTVWREMQLSRINVPNVVSFDILVE